MLNKSLISSIELLYCYQARVANIIASFFAILLLYALCHFAITCYHITSSNSDGKVNTTVNLMHTDLAAIMQLNLLGKTNSKPSQAGLYCVDSGKLPDDAFLHKAPKARLLARLAGVLYSSDPKDSIAIIEQGEEQTSYVLGDRLDNKQQEIVKIFPDSVIFRDGNCYSMLAVD